MMMPYKLRMRRGITSNRHREDNMNRRKFSIFRLDFFSAGVMILALIVFGLVPPDSRADTSDYVLIGWNDLGMHCINPSYKELALLPPFNNLWVQVIQRGDPPPKKIVTPGITLEYSIVNNTTVQGKTDFWQYVYKLFNVNLPPGYRSHRKWSLRENASGRRPF